MPLEFVFPCWGWKKPHHLPQKKKRCLCFFWHSQLLKVRVFAASTDKGPCDVSFYFFSWVPCVSFPSSTVRSDSFSCSLLYLWDSSVPHFSFLPCSREFVPLNFHLSLSNRIPHSVSKLGALCTSDSNFWTAKGGIYTSPNRTDTLVWLVLGWFFFFSFPIYSVITGLAMPRCIIMLQGITEYVTSQVLQVIGAGSSAPWRYQYLCFPGLEFSVFSKTSVSCQ